MTQTVPQGPSVRVHPEIDPRLILRSTQLADPLTLRGGSKGSNAQRGRSVQCQRCELLILSVFGGL